MVGQPLPMAAKLKNPRSSAPTNQALGRLLHIGFRSGVAEPHKAMPPRLVEIHARSGRNADFRQHPRAKSDAVFVARADIGVNIKSAIGAARDTKPGAGEGL